MAIITDLMITIDSGYDNPKYGVSRALSNYSLDEIWQSCYVGANFPVHRMISKSPGTGTLYWSTATTRPYTIGSLIYQWGMNIGARISASGAVDDDEYAEDGIYTKTIWLYSASTIPQTVTDLSSVRMVTQMDFTRFKLIFERSTGQSTGEGGVTWGDNKSYGTVKSNAYLLDNSDPDNPVWQDTGNITLIKPYQMVKIDDKYCLIDALTTGYYANYAGEYYDGATPITKELVTGFSSVDGTLKFGLLQSLKKTSDSYSEIRWQESTWAVNYPSMYDNYKAYMQNRTTSQGYNQTVVYPTSQDEFQKNIMGYGVYFQTDRTYKPIISDGYVTGYTSDLTADSELDGYTGSSIHVVPDIKPGPPTPTPPSPGHWDDIDSSGAYENVANFIRAYYISGTELQNLRTWMSKTEAEGGAPDGYDFMDAIIGIKAYPFSLASTASDTIDIVIPNAGEMWMEILQETWIATIAAQLTGQTLPGVPQSITRHVNTGISAMATNCAERHWCLGSIDMSQFTNSTYPFLTYDAAVELYIPFVGTFVLDTQSVMGRTLTAYIYLDPLTGGVYGYCMCGGTMIASGTGNIGVDVPISANQIGLFQAEKDKLRSQAEVGLITTAATIAAPMVGASMAGSSAAFALANQYRGKVGADTLNTFARQAYNNAYDRRMANTDVSSSAAVATIAQAHNANRQIKYLAQSHNMSMTGSIGSSVAEWSCPRDAYIKITRPKAKDPGENYNHACGVPCYSSGTLDSFTGLTVCIDPDVSGIDATPEERNAIASILSGGVIV